MKPQEPQRILLATDFSPCSQPASDYAAVLARRFGAGLHLLYVAQPPTFVSPEAISVVDEAIDAEVHDGHVRLDRALAELQRADVRANGEVIVGFASDVIVAAAASGKHDLVVIGTHGRGGIKHLVLGSVAEQVVRRSPIPVLTVRAPAR
ncbi:MAG TPA: universal stress protein [Polyangia bacterium]|jgi:nucleotide-binding universal stress UspA family protein|nr:universal stress protein [Polyangia bacterium]